MKTTLYAFSTLTNTIIGVGIFILPYIASQVGFWVMLAYFVVLSIVAILVHILLAEVVMRTEGKHRLTGYAEIYLGPRGKMFAFADMIFGLGGALFSYLIIGSNFLFTLAAPSFGGTHFLYLLFFLTAGSILIYFGSKSISRIDFVGLIIFFSILTIIFIKGLPLIKLDNLFISTPLASRPLFLPYGAILFSLWGASSIPEITELMKGRLHNLKRLISVAILMPALTYLSFIFLVTGITGQNTSKDAIIGLRNFFGNSIGDLGLIIGILTTFTCFITLGLTLKKVFWYDLKINPFISWLIVCLMPLILYLSGLKDFTRIISLVGGVMIGLDGILIILIYLKAKKNGHQTPPWHLPIATPLVYSLLIFLILGIVYEIFYFVR